MKTLKETLLNKVEIGTIEYGFGAENYLYFISSSDIIHESKKVEFISEFAKPFDDEIARLREIEKEYKLLYLIVGGELDKIVNSK